MGMDEFIRYRLVYEAGQLHWKKLGLRGIRPGRAGTKFQCGRRYVKVMGRSLLEHRVVWFLVHGEWPKGEIDHINGVKDDNRIENLRDVDHRTNLQNQRRARKDNACGALGVYQIKRSGKWHAQILRGPGESRHIGTFGTKEQAAAAYVDAKRIAHAGCTI
jgi:hypothetical protein